MPTEGLYYLAFLTHVGEDGPEHFYNLELNGISGNLLENGSFEEGKRTADGRRETTFTTVKEYKKIVVILRYARQEGKVWFDGVRLRQQ